MRAVDRRGSRVLAAGRCLVRARTDLAQLQVEARSKARMDSGGPRSGLEGQQRQMGSVAVCRRSRCRKGWAEDQRARPSELPWRLRMGTASAGQRDSRLGSGLLVSRRRLGSDWEANSGHRCPSGLGVGDLPRRGAPARRRYLRAPSGCRLPLESRVRQTARAGKEMFTQHRFRQTWALFQMSPSSARRLTICPRSGAVSTMKRISSKLCSLGYPPHSCVGSLRPGP